MSIPSPMHSHSVPLRFRLKHFKIMTKVRECVFLDGRKITQLLPFRHSQGDFVPLLAKHPDQFVEANFMGFVLNKLNGFLCLIDGSFR